MASINEQQLQRIASELKGCMDRSHGAREKALVASRAIIQLSSKTIKALHREDRTLSKELLAQTAKTVQLLKEDLSTHPEIYHSGYIHDAQKEYVEASVMFSLVFGTELDSPNSLCVEPAAYLNGMAEAASEARRFLLDRLRGGDTDRANALLIDMDAMYNELIGFDYPDAITGGLRRTTDALRAVLERTRSDLTMTTIQNRLIRALNENKSHETGT